jgi:hypothetical protein
VEGAGSIYTHAQSKTHANGGKMTIPDKVKIGGITYTVENNAEFMHIGTAGYTAEIRYSDAVIRITNQNEQVQQRDFLHEIIHGIYHDLGYDNHDEKKIDELAGALYQLIVDNPEIFRPRTP